MTLPADLETAGGGALSQIYVEASHTSQTNARTGIQTVVRGLVSGLAAAGCSVHPLRWSFRKNGLTLLKPAWQGNLGLAPKGNRFLPLASVFRPRFWPVWRSALGLSYRVPIHRHPSHENHFANGWLILPELAEGCHVRRIVQYARDRGLRVAGIFHDAIAWLHPEIVRHWTCAQHEDYMEAFASLDVIIAVSRQSARDFAAFAESRGIAAPPVRVAGLASEIRGWARETRPEGCSDGVVRILCVSTLEPRKNHASLVQAFLRASARSGGVKMEMHFVGAPYECAPEIADAMRAAERAHPSLHWHGAVDAETLGQLYRRCDFTVFGSRIEGFGLPVLESLWFGKPCLCSDEGVIAENAAGGGCLTVDVRDVEALAGGMVRLAEDQEYRRELGGQARRRRIKTWPEYAAEILEILKGI
jgi:glycosyltransferase involved in cell wall biosynthesis